MKTTPALSKEHFMVDPLDSDESISKEVDATTFRFVQAIKRMIAKRTPPKSLLLLRKPFRYTIELLEWGLEGNPLPNDIQLLEFYEFFAPDNKQDELMETACRLEEILKILGILSTDVPEWDAWNKANERQAEFRKRHGD